MRRGRVAMLLLLAMMCSGASGFPDDVFLIALANFFTNLVMSLLSLFFFI
jgi:hypothetical protein